MEGGSITGNGISVIIYIIIADGNRYVFGAFPNRIIRWRDDDIDKATIFDVGIGASVTESIAIADRIVDIELGRAPKCQGNLDEGVSIGVCIASVVVIRWYISIGRDSEFCWGNTLNTIDGCAAQAHGKLGSSNAIFNNIGSISITPVIIPFTPIARAPHQHLIKTTTTPGFTAIPVVV